MRLGAHRGGPLAAASARHRMNTAPSRTAPTKAAVCFGCHGPNGNSSNPAWPTLAGQNARLRGRAVATVSLQGARQPGDGAADRLTHRCRTSTIWPCTLRRKRQPGLEADPSYWKAGQLVYERGDKSRADSGVHRLPWARRARQSRRRLSGAARAAVGLHDEAAQRLRAGHPLCRAPRDKNPASPNGYIMATIAKRLDAGGHP